MTLPQVQILLATYNGEKYLPEQLDSIAAQSYPHWTILARDDGSRDATPDILRRFQEKHPGRLTLVQDSLGNMGGAAENFLRLTALSSASYLAFADQDDIWHPHKISRSVAKILEMEKQYGQDVPAMVHHDFSLVDAGGKILIPSYDRAHGNLRAANKQVRMPFCGFVHGFSMTINRALVERALPAPEKLWGHDTLFANLTQDFGHVAFIDEPLADYRRHGNNVSDLSSYQRRFLHEVFSSVSSPRRLMSLLLEAHRKAQNNLSVKSEIAHSYLERYGSELGSERRALLEAFTNVQELGMWERKIMLVKYVAESTRTRLLAGLML